MRDWRAISVHMAFNLRMTEEQRSRLEAIRLHYGLQNLAAAVWFAVAELWRRVTSDKGER
jgi:hypothetical protein